MDRRPLILSASLAFAASTLMGGKASAAEPATGAAAAVSPGDAPGPNVEAAAEPGAGAAEPTPQGRELGGHTFMPILGMVSPFTTTSFGTFLSVGYGSTTGRLSLQLPGNPPPPPTIISGSVSYAAIGGVVGFEAAFLQHFSARVIFTETLYSGTTGAAAAMVGSNARLGADFGLTASLPLTPSIRVAAVVDASFAPSTGILLGPAIKSTFDSCAMGITNCRFEFSQLFEQRNVVTVEPGGAASWALYPFLGVTTNLTYAHGSLTNSNSGSVSTNAMSAGIAADFDFYAISDVPVGIQLSWNSRWVFSESTEGFTDLGGAVFYTGRKNLSIGFQLVDRRFRVVPDVDVSWKTFIALTGLRYYW
jgi:hypothetical protein